MTAGWTVRVIEHAGPPAQGDKRSKSKTHRVVAVDATRERVISRDVTADELATFDPEMAWRGALASRRGRRS